MTWDVVKDHGGGVCTEKWRGDGPPFVITFDQFVEAYTNGPYSASRVESLRALADDPHRFEDPTGIGFLMRTRVPNGQGFFGADAKGAQWCDPKDWHRLYYLARKAVSPSMFPDNP